MENNDTQNLAVRIANLLRESRRETTTAENDFVSLRTSLEKINERLDKIEISLNLQSTNLPQHAFQIPHSLHPSREKFEIAEAVAYETNENFEAEKICPYEPTGKLCDHCSMCSSRGF